MIENRCPEHVEKCKAFAATLERKKDGQWGWHKEPVESLAQCLDRYNDDDEKLVVIMEEDHSPYSFYFHVYTLVKRTTKPDTRGLGGRGGENYIKDGREWKFFYDGGIIFADYSNNWGMHT